MKHWALILVASGLAIIGLVMLRSIAPEFVPRQALAIGLAGGLIWGISQLSFFQLTKLSRWSYWGLNLILAFLLIMGATTRGTVGWFSLGGGFKFQPSQFAVPIASLFLMAHFDPAEKIKHWLDWIKLVGFWLLPAILIGLEPDFGSTIVYLISTGVLLILFKINWKIWLGLLGFGIVAGMIGWFSLFQAYQRDRILSFLTPDVAGFVDASDETSAQYNARQALIAVGSGGLFGRGLGYGIQSHLRFLPEKQTDFIFAALSEELGLLGSLSVIVCYIMLITLLWWQLFQQTDQQKLGFLLSLIMLIFIQSAINIGMNIGLLPITGITLPLVSYGGSSVIGFSLALGVAQVISRETKKRLALQIR